MANVLITGAGGQLGRELQYLSRYYSGHSFHFLTRDSLDITDEQAIEEQIRQHRIDVVINCAAYTAVDKAEEEVLLAQKINAEAPGFLAKACANQQAFLIHISTDYVYHNGMDRPFTEADPCQPQSVYARTKLEGEIAARAYPEHSMVLRTSWVYSTYGHNFVKTMARLGAERDQLRIVYDQIGAPTYARDLAQAILRIVQNKQYQQHPGIYNFSNEGVTSWYDFALSIFTWLDLDCEVTPIRSAEYPTPAKRPAYSVLDKQLFKDTFGQTIPHWQESLWACLDEGLNAD